MSHVLEPPSYGWMDGESRLIVPGAGQIGKEFLFRLNIFRDKKNWLSFFSWLKVLILLPCLFLFFFRYFNVYILAIAFVYSMVIMGTHGTIWYHRYCTHGAFTFTNRFWRFVTKNLTISMIPEEIYVISHHVHHAMPDKPGDPYNASAGFLYCFLADVNHQPVARDLTEEQYDSVVKLMDHTGVLPNSYAQYKKMGLYRPAGALTGFMAPELELLGYPLLFRRRPRTGAGFVWCSRFLGDRRPDLQL